LTQNSYENIAPDDSSSESAIQDAPSPLRERDEVSNTTPGGPTKVEAEGVLEAKPSKESVSLKAANEKFETDYGSKMKEILDKMKRVEKEVFDHEPFQIIKQDKIFYIAMPKNFCELIDQEGFRELAAIIESSKFKLIECEKSIKIVPSKDVATFFKGLYNRIFKDDWSKEDTFKPCSTKPAGRGRATFDLYVLKKSSKIMNIENYLGETAKSPGGNSHLTHYLSALGGASGAKVFGKVDQVIKDLMADRYDSIELQLDELVSNHKLELSQCTREYKKIKHVKVKGRSNTSRPITISPSRISTTPYVFTTDEKDAFEKQEECFDKIEEINTKYSGGVPIREFKEVQTEYSKNITFAWNYCSKYSKFKSARLKSIKEVLQLSKRQTDDFKISKNNVTLMWNNLGHFIKTCYSDGEEHALDTVLYALSSVLVDSKINTKYFASKNMVAKALGIRRCTVQDELDTARILYEHICVLTQDVIRNTAPSPPVLSKIERRKKPKEIRPDEKFDGEETYYRTPRTEAEITAALYDSNEEEDN
jgi:hypothetical protein